MVRGVLPPSEPVSRNDQSEWGQWRNRPSSSYLRQWCARCQRLHHYRGRSRGRAELSLGSEISVPDVTQQCDVYINLTKVKPLFTVSHRGSDNSPLLTVFKWTLYEVCSLHTGHDFERILNAVHYFWRWWKQCFRVTLGMKSTQIFRNTFRCIKV